jgi:U3 small nucleolar RNA-associated protein 14
MPDFVLPGWGWGGGGGKKKIRVSEFEKLVGKELRYLKCCI